MASKRFQDLLMKNVATGNGPRKSKQSISWFRDNVVKISSRKNGIGAIEIDDTKKVRSWTNLGIGSMYFAYYDPKHKETLKYYDNFPLIIPIERYPDGILALNLHYISPALRAALLDSLIETANDPTLDDGAKMKINYQILSRVANSKLFKPCIKRYLGKHFVTEFVKIHPSAWETAIYMPTESFQKASKQQVWAESRKMGKR